MEKYKSMLVEAIKNSDIIPPKQKGTLEVLCLSEYPLTASAIEKKLKIALDKFISQKSSENKF